MLLKIAVLVTTVWLTIAILLFIEDREQISGEGSGGPAAAALFRGGGGPFSGEQQREVNPKPLHKDLSVRQLHGRDKIVPGSNNDANSVRKENMGRVDPLDPMDELEGKMVRRNLGGESEDEKKVEDEADQNDVGGGGGGGNVNGGMEAEEGVLAIPKGDDLKNSEEKLYGEFGVPVTFPANVSSDVKKLIDEGWQKNAFNQYASDLISVHRKLPDPRDKW